MTTISLSKATGAALHRAEVWLPYIVEAMEEFEINTPLRKAAFLAQIGHESGGLYYTSEIWGPTKAQSRYEGRSDLGNTQPGDGSRYRGRGLIQITGRANYRTVGYSLGINLLDNPELLEQREPAARSAAWFWKSHGCNEMADTGEFEKITRTINGGLNGYDRRVALYEAAMEVVA